MKSNNELIKDVYESYQKYIRSYGDFKDDFLNYLSKSTQMKKWDKMCSIQDWIDVTINRVNKMNFENYKEFGIEEKTFFIIELITCINIIVDSVEGINHIIGITNGKYDDFITSLKTFTMTRKLNTEHDKYLNIEMMNDRDYFKHLRSVFGQHPSNLNVNNQKIFASWTLDYNSGESDLFVNVYVNDPDNGWGLKMNVVISDLLDFYRSYFDVGCLLMSFLEEKVKNYFDSMKTDKLYEKTDDDATKITKLKEAIIKRYYYKDQSYYYTSLIEIEEGLHNVTINKFIEIYKDYKRLLYLSLDEIHERVKVCSNDNLFVVNKIDVSCFDISGFDYIAKKAEAYIGGDKRHLDNYIRSCKEIANVLDIDFSQIKTYADYRFLKFVLKKKT